jgi:hypothetical protein
LFDWAHLSARLLVLNVVSNSTLLDEHNFLRWRPTLRPNLRLLSHTRSLEMSGTPDDMSQTCDTGSLIPPAGFGFEFDTKLEERLLYHEEQSIARLERYGRFGMTREEALRATPEHYRQQYDRLLEQVLTEDTPPTSPSPSPTAKELAVKHLCEPTRYEPSDVRKYRRSVHSSSDIEAGRPKHSRGCRKSPTHGMETRLKRSRKQLYTRAPFLALPY